MYTRHILISILLLAVLLRIPGLGQIPSGLTWDEAAIGYSAYGILTNRRDEWLERVPIVFRSFGDFKSPLLVYTTVPFVAVFGLTPFAVRLPIAIASIVLVAIAYAITRILARDHLHLGARYSVMAATTAALFVAISPLALQFSRIGFESMLAAVCISGAVLLYLYGLQAGSKEHVGRHQYAWFFVAHTLSIASVYAYHSAKVVVPLLLACIALMLWKYQRASLLPWLRMGILAAIFAVPLLFSMVFGNANGRAATTTIFSEPAPINHFFRNVLSHLDPRFLVLGYERTYRHSTQVVGILSYSEAILLLAGLGCIFLLRTVRQPLLLLLFFIAVGLLPALLGKDVPHANRALLVLPWIQVFSGLILALIVRQAVLSKIKIAIVAGITMVSFIGIIRWVHAYTTTYQTSTALRDFGYGYQELFGVLRPLESKYSKIYLTNAYGQAYIYALFFKRLTPIEYQQGGLANYTITTNPLKDGQGTPNALLVLSDEEPPDSATVLAEIRYPDNQIAFRVVRVQ